MFLYVKASMHEHRALTMRDPNATTLVRRADHDICKKKTDSAVSNYPPKTDYVFLFHRTNTEDRVAQSNLDGGFIMSPKADGRNYGLKLFYARLSLDDGDGHDLRS